MILNLATRIWLAVWRHWASLSTAIVDRSTEKSYLDATERRISWRAVARSLPFHIALYVYLVFAICRLFFASYVLYTGLNREEYFEIDALVAMGNKIKVFNYTTALCVATFPIFVIYLDYLIFVRRSNYIWHLGHDIMVRNGKRFWRLNAHLCPPSIRQLFTQPIPSVRRLWTIAKQFYRYDASRNEYGCGGPVRFDQPYLKYYPHLSVIARVRLVAINWFMTLVNSIFIICTVLVVIAGLIYYNFVLLLPNIEHTWRKITQGMAEICVIGLCAITTIRVCLFLMQTLYSIRFGMALFYFDMERKFHRLLQRVELSNLRRLHRSSSSSPPPPSSSARSTVVIKTKKCKDLSGKMATFLKFFRAQQVQLANHVVHANRYIISTMLLTAAISNFWLNLYLLSALYFVALSRADRIMITALVALQTLFLLGGLLPMAYMTKVLHRPAKSMLFRAQSCLRSGRCGKNRKPIIAIVRAKIKLLTQYEQMHCANQIQFSIGPIMEISRKSIFELFFMYSAYLMVIFSIISESDLRASNMSKTI